MDAEATSKDEQEEFQNPMPYSESADIPTSSSGQPSSAAAQHNQQPDYSNAPADMDNGVDWDRLEGTEGATNDPLSAFNEQPNVGRATVPHDQPHWQDDYATNWDRVGMNRHESSSDAAANAMQQISNHALLDQDQQQQPQPGKSKVWACKLCTFAENPSHTIRCEVCDTTRGSTLQDVQRKPVSSFRPEGIDTKSKMQLGSQVDTDAGISQPLHPRSDVTRIGNTGRALHGGDRPDVLTMSKPNKVKGSGKRSQQSISGYLDAQQDTKRINAQAVSSDKLQHNTQKSIYSDAKWQCYKCKQWFQLGEQAEHIDYHVALDLHKQASRMQEVQQSASIQCKQKTA